MSWGDFIGITGMTRGRMLERTVFNLTLFMCSGWWPFAVCAVIGLAAWATFGRTPDSQESQ